MTVVVAMPIIQGSDSRGRYYKVFNARNKYHYRAGDSRSRTRAKNKAKKQLRAIKASQSRKYF